MPVIKHQIFIHAKINDCFDLARNVDIHTKTTGKTKEKAVAGKTEGILGLGDCVTWEAVHFGIKQRLTAKMTIVEAPHKFVDVMVKGAFHSFTHTHLFHEENGGTVMTDLFDYKSPFGFFGRIADSLFLKKYMERFIKERAEELKKIAEEKII